MKKVRIRIGSGDDLDLLAVFNHQLVEDEGHDNQMNLEQLERMNGFILSDYRAYLFENETRVIGYAL